MRTPRSASSAICSLSLALTIGAATAGIAAAAQSASPGNPTSAAGAASANSAAHEAGDAPTPGDRFKLYPGAEVYTPPETEETKLFHDSLRPGTTITAYFTHDPYAKVLEFYRRLGKEYTKGKSSKEKLPGGEQVKKAFVILDGAPDLMSSKSWLTVQHPFIGSRRQGVPEDVRDVTEIVLTVRKPVPKEKPKELAAPPPH